jgi:hypothetical protein
MFFNCIIGILGSLQLKYPGKWKLYSIYLGIGLQSGWKEERVKLMKLMMSMVLIVKMMNGVLLTRILVMIKKIKMGINC